LVSSLAHPGGNITGVTFLAGPEIAGKQLELLRQIAPTASRVAVLVNPRNASHAGFRRRGEDGRAETRRSTAERARGIAQSTRARFRLS
jgi:hypothetical protein